MKDLINWRELSRILTGNEFYIRRNKIPKKYEAAVSSLLSDLIAWNKEFKTK